MISDKTKTLLVIALQAAIDELEKSKEGEILTVKREVSIIKSKKSVIQIRVEVSNKITSFLDDDATDKVLN